MGSQYISPNGSPIVGTAETLAATAQINGINDDGTPDFVGESDIHWDTQETVTNADGKIMFVDEAGDEWTFDQLTKADDEDEDADAMEAAHG